MSVVEICVDNAHGVKLASAGGADRVELCSQLWCGGLTPCDDDVLAALPYAPPLGIQFLIRVRAGNFIYRTDEISQMLDDMARISELVDAHAPGIRHGFVVGALTPEYSIDMEAAMLFREAAGAHHLTFHRAFDMLAAPVASTDQLVDLGYQSILTTGASLTGGDLAAASPGGLQALVQQSAGRISILASGGLRSGNVARVIAASGVTQVHMRAPGPDGNGTDLAEVRRIVATVRNESRDSVKASFHKNVIKP